MKINNIDFSLNDDDLNRFLARFAPPSGKISHLRIELQAGRLVVFGRANIFLNINFQAVFALSHTATEIIARLESIKPASALANLFKNKILENIADYRSFIQHDKDDDAIRIGIEKIVEKQVESANVEIVELTAAKDKLTVTLQGEMTF